MRLMPAMVNLFIQTKIIIEKLNESVVTARKINTWPIWSKEVSKFDWYYDCDEECLVLQGEVVVHTDHGDFTIKEGDFVTFKKGLKCVWEVKKAIRKHYNFPE